MTDRRCHPDAAPQRATTPFRWRHALAGRAAALLMAAVLAGVGLAGTARAQSSPAEEAEDALERYLQRRAMTALQIEHLEQRLAAAGNAEARFEIAKRLADAYAAMVERAPTFEEREHWAARAEALIDQSSGDETDDLRLSVANARYRALEQAVGAWRLRLDDHASRPGSGAPAPITQVEQELKRLADSMATVAERANARAAALERQRDRATGSTLILLDDEIDRANRRRSLANYLAGWCAYHVAEIQADRMIANRLVSTDSPRQMAIVAQQHFSWLLGEQDGQLPAIDRISDALLAFEHVARAALGHALAESIRGINDQARTNSALDWLDRIEGCDRVSPEIVRQIPTARALTLARGRRWNELDHLITRLHQGETTLPPALARLLVVLTLDQPDATSDELAAMRSVRTTAIADLITSGNMAQVLDLASRLGLEQASQDATGFVGLYAAALEHYQKLRDRLESRSENFAVPTADTLAIGEAIRAAQLVGRALEADDAAQFAGVQGQTQMVLGASLFHASGASAQRLRSELGTDEPLLLAAAAFASASQQLTERSQISHALWMAIRAIDAHVTQHPSTPPLQQRRQDYVQTFITRFPTDDRATALKLQNAQRSRTPTEVTLQELLEVPETSRLHEATRRHAAQMAYELCRAADPEERQWKARRYLGLAEPLLALDVDRALRGDAQAAALAVTQARRMFETLLDTPEPPGHEGLRRAQHVLDQLVRLAGAPALQDTPAGRAATSEAMYREAQLALAQGDHARAQRIVQELAALGPEAASQAIGLLYLHHQQRWNALDEQRAAGSVTIQERLDTGRRLLDAGGQLVRSLEQRGVGTDNPTLVTVLFNIAQTALELWTLSRDPALLELSRTTIAQLLEAHPRDRAIVRAHADTAAAAGAHAEAVEGYRLLLPALAPGSDEWFEVRTLLIESLAMTDPARAREVIAQHVALHPEYGPAPWGERLRRVAERLGQRGTGGGS
jgi:hypothetical protein